MNKESGLTLLTSTFEHKVHCGVIDECSIPLDAHASSIDLVIAKLVNNQPYITWMEFMPANFQKCTMLEDKSISEYCFSIAVPIV